MQAAYRMAWLCVAWHGICRNAWHGHVSLMWPCTWGLCHVSLGLVYTQGYSLASNAHLHVHPRTRVGPIMPSGVQARMCEQRNVPLVSEMDPGAEWIPEAAPAPPCSAPQPPLSGVPQSPTPSRLAAPPDASHPPCCLHAPPTISEARLPWIPSIMCCAQVAHAIARIALQVPHTPLICPWPPSAIPPCHLGAQTHSYYPLPSGCDGAIGSGLPMGAPMPSPLPPCCPRRPSSSESSAPRSESCWLPWPRHAWGPPAAPHACLGSTRWHAWGDLSCRHAPHVLAKAQAHRGLRNAVAAHRVCLIRVMSHAPYPAFREATMPFP